MLKKVVFLDRDGVINKDSPDYIKDWSEFMFLPQALDALANLHANGFTCIIITNQSAINRKISSKKNIEYIHHKMIETIRLHNGNIKDIFFCPHRPDQNCNCRKPEPGMILKAKELYNIDLSDSVMVGDSAKDIECGKNACCGYTVLVRTGNINQAQKLLAMKNIGADYVAKDILDSSNWIINKFLSFRKIIPDI